MPRICPVCSSGVAEDVATCPADGAILLLERPRGMLAGAVVAGRYSLGPRVGGGAMGDVHRAVDQTMGRSVAVKVLHTELSADAATLDRVFAQSRLISRLKHPQTVTVHDFGKTPDGQGFLVMDLLEGEDLRKKLERDGRIPPQRSLSIARQVADSLAEAHAQGVVHGCVKPGHIILRDAFGRIDVATVVDYGVSRAVRWSAAQAGGGQAFGHPGYVSPEVLRGEDPTPRSDLYGLGIVLFELLTGVHPFAAANSTGLIMRVLNEAPPSLNAVAARLHLPPGIEPLVHSLMAPEPDARFGSASEVMAAIDEIQEAAELDATTVFVMPTAQSATESVAVVHQTPRGEAEAAKAAATVAATGPRLNQARSRSVSQAALPVVPPQPAAEAPAPVVVVAEPGGGGRGLLVALLVVLIILAGLAIAVLLRPEILDRLIPPRGEVAGAPPAPAPHPTVAPPPKEVEASPSEAANAEAAKPEARASIREPSIELERHERLSPADEEEVKAAQKAKKEPRRVLKAR